MQLFGSSFLLGGLALAATTAAQTSTKQACPSNDVDMYQSCICPFGTDYQISTTYATLGVNAKDFAKYTSSFYDIAWQGITNLTRNGPEGQVGATRTFTSPTTVGTLTFTEKLDSFQSKPDGSYVARFSQFNTPIAYTKGNGSFSGYWITFDAQYAAPYETVLHWQVYACFVGNPFNFGKGHLNALNGLIATMSKAGLVKGNVTTAYYNQSF